MKRFIALSLVSLTLAAQAYSVNCLPGDMNDDGAVNPMDIAPFVNALVSGSNVCPADTNIDGRVNALDIRPFVALMQIGSICGDGEAEGSEVCDGEDLNGETCESQGFEEGTLACAAGCFAFNTSDCQAGSMQSQVSQYGITWTFDRPYQVGQFVTGDYWVTPDTATGTVTVVSVSPAQSGSGSSRRNGSMLNASGVPVKGNAYDGRTYDYRSELSVSYPITLHPGDSLLSSKSQAEDWPYEYAKVQTVGILTCLAVPAPADAFRPHYGANNETKVIFRTGDLRLERLLNVAPALNPPPITSLERSFERPWVDHFNSYFASASAPHLNLYSNRYGNQGYISYGRERGTVVGEAALMLLSDSVVVGNKERLLHRFIQVGIDAFGLRENGYTIGGNGGHMSGRKLPMLFAGYLLNHEGMLSVGFDYISSVDGPVYFQEDGQTAYVTQAAIDMTLNCELTGNVAAATANTITFDRDTQRHVIKGSKIQIISGTGAGQIREVSTMNLDTETATLTVSWSVVPNSTSRYQMLGYQQFHLGMPEWAGYFGDGWRSQANPGWGHYYRDINGKAWGGECLAMRMLGLREIWNHQAWFDYVDRHMAVTDDDGSGDQWGYHYPDAGARSLSPWAARMWDLYRSDY